MLPLTEFRKPLVLFQFPYGAPPQYRRKFPARINQTFPMPPKRMTKPRPRLLPENIKQYPYDVFGRRLYYVR